MEEKKEEIILDDEKTVTEIVDESINEGIYGDTKDTDLEKKKLSRKEKKINKMRIKLLDPMDIKYRGPLSYRHLRIIAWIAMACAQLLIVSNISGAILANPIVSGPWLYILSVVADLSVPLFFIAVIATILNKSRSYKKILIVYAALYLGIGLAVVVVFRRYLYGFFATMSAEAEIPTTPSLYAGELIGQKFDFNVFSDLLMLSLFNYFIIYNPKKLFQGKKIIIFRLFALIPLLFTIASYILKVSAGFSAIRLPFELYPFLTTKPPLVHLLFIFLTIWMKRRDQWFKKLGATEEEYERYHKSNKNSLSFSKALSIFLVITAVIDFVLLIILAVASQAIGIDLETLASIFQIGNTVGLIIAIPFVLLFSYTRSYPDGSNIDLLIPLIGIGLIALTYVEGIYQIVLALLAS